MKTVFIVALIAAAVVPSAVAFSLLPGALPGRALRSSSSTACSLKPVLARRPVRSVGLRTLKAQETQFASEKLSLLQKEKLYLDCCAAYNVDQKSLISDEEFETLKNDLSFEGSKVIMMTRDEIKFMVATARFNEGKPIMEDSAYDALRNQLKAINSPAVFHEAPRCKLTDSGKTECKADLSGDDGKNALLYTPALVLVALLVNEFTFWAYSWDPLLSLIVGSPVIAGVSWGLTNFIYFQKPFITKAQCPKCSAPQNIYFGDVLFVNGGKPGDVVDTQCVNKACGCNLKAYKNSMVVMAAD